jgi:hypothetical protein
MLPEKFNRFENTSKADFQAFVDWLLQNTATELKEVREDVEGTKAAWFRYFRQGLAAKLTPEELDSYLPKLFRGVRYNADQAVRVLTMIKGMYLINFGETPETRAESNESISISEARDGSAEDGSEASPDTRVAERFGNLVASGDYVAAHSLLTTEAQGVHSPGALKEAVEEMTAYAPGPIRQVEVMEDTILRDWPDKQEGDVAWVYVSLVGDSYAEAVSLVLAEQAGATRIRHLEWGRP